MAPPTGPTVCLVLLLAALTPAAALGLRANVAQDSSTVRGPAPPRWPAAYEVVYTLRLPYLETIQVAGLKIPVHVWYDGSSGLTRMDVYGGLDSTYVLPEYTYNLFPRIDKKTCWRIDTTAGPTVAGRLRNEGGNPPPLPDISSWQYAGSTRIAGVPAYIWSLTENHFDKTNVYTFYTSQADERPLKLYMAGVNLFSGSHFDEYIVDFTLFNKLFPASATIFKPPPLCATAEVHALGAAPLAQALALLPSRLTAAPAAAVAAVAAALNAQAQQQQGGAGEGAALMPAAGLPAPHAHAHLEANWQLVDTWNARHAESAGFKLSLNRFAAWPHDHFVATRMGHAAPTHADVKHLRQRPSSAYLGTYQRQVADSELPPHVDYRGTGADGPVKDQASCGSCWAFGTTGTMTGTWFKATGEALSLSEQHIVDCSWDYEVNGCWGGFGESAMDLVKASGGAIMEDEYPYIGQNGYCRSDASTKAAFFSGYKDIAEGDEHALMEALATQGPLYVALDASDPKFKFYSEGVYHRDDCATDRDHLNHAVTLVGYGTTEQGVDYWLIRNSWSKLWGEDGYIKITRKGNDCGITTGAMLAIPDQAAVARTRARLASAQV